MILLSVLLTQEIVTVLDILLTKGKRDHNKFKQSEKYTPDHICWECGEVIIICTAYPAEIVALDCLNVFIDKGTRDYEIKSKIYMNDIYLTSIIKNNNMVNSCT